MRNITRRRFLAGTIAAILIRGGFLSQVAAATALEGTENNDRTVEEWMDEWMDATGAFQGTLHVSRFAEPIWFLLKPITWRPNESQSQYKTVQVPVGFVTDFASIPRVFWSLLPPDGIYTYPAIIHDFLYWTQTVSREVADKIFKFSMEEFGVRTLTSKTIYTAVRVAGTTSWNRNATLKKNGEKRILKRFPDDPMIRWDEWKTHPDVFG